MRTTLWCGGSDEYTAMVRNMSDDKNKVELLYDQETKELIKKYHAFSIRETPIILSSGNLGFYDLDMSKFLKDDEKFKQNKDSSHDMIKIATAVAEEDSDFEKLIDKLAEKAKSLVAKFDIRDVAVSGAQPVDWIFSGPVSKKMGVGHISLYGDNEKVEYIYDSKISDITREGIDYNVLHISAIIGDAKDLYRVEMGQEKGYITMLRDRGANVEDLIAVVSREMRGEKRLKGEMVSAHPFAAVDEDFIISNAKETKETEEEIVKKSEEYVKEHGAIPLIDYFDPRGKHLERARLFFKKYGRSLMGHHMSELSHEVQRRYRKSLTSY